MFVEKMQFPMPMAAAYEGCSTHAEKAESTVKAFLEAKAEEEAAFTVKAKAEEDAAFLKAKAEEMVAFLKAKAEEEAAFTVKAEEEAAFTVKAGCGSKRKAEEYREEKAAVTVKSKVEEDAAVTVKSKVEEEVDKVVANATTEEVEEYSDCDSDEEADEDDESFLARIAAEFNAREEKMMANYPGMTYRDYELDPLDQSDDDQDDTPYEFDNAYYQEYFRRKQEQEAAGSHAVDGPVVV